MPAAGGSGRSAIRSTWQAMFLFSGSHSGARPRLRGYGFRARELALAPRNDALHPSPRRKQRPQLVGAARGDHVAELDGPVALVAEIVAPCPQPARETMQHVFMGEAD